MISLRRVATVLAVAVTAGVVALAHAGSADYVLPVDKHSSAKGQALARKYRPQLLELSDYVYHCLPYLEVRNGLGFKRLPKGSTDDRYVSIWVRAEQAPDPTFAAMPVERQASAMFSRYGVPMLKRLAALPGLQADPDLYGYSVVVEWVKPTGDQKVPTMEILSMFADKATTQAFLSKSMSGADYVQGTQLTFFDGTKEVGRIPIEVWEDNFVGTYQVPGYELEKGKVCS